MIRRQRGTRRPPDAAPGHAGPARDGSRPEPGSDAAPGTGRWVREAEAELFYEHAPLGLAILDAELRYVRVNRTLAVINGVPVEDHIGRTVRDVVPDLADEVEDRMREVLATGAAMRDLEISGETPSEPGVTRSWTESWIPLRDHEGTVVGLSVIIYETTDLRRIEHRLRELTTDLERQVAERTALAELRSRQLQALAVEVIEAGELERSQIAELLHDELQQIIASARLHLDAAARTVSDGGRLAGVDDLLRQALGISARLSHHLSPALLHHVDLRSALEWLARDMAEQFALEVEIATGDLDDITGTAVTTFVFRAVEELLLNVVKHAGTPGARVTVNRSGDRVAVRVADEGRGFDPGAVASADTPVGFGLLKLRERASFIGGSLEIDSEPGRGAAVTLTIPLRLESDAADAAAATSDELLRTGDGPRPFAADGRLRLLVVDDHQMMRQGLVGMLDDQPDIEVVGEAADGLEAVELARSLRPDVVVMDVSMPVMDGIESTRRITAELAGVRVVGLTMHDDDGIARSMREAGAEAFVSKNASSDELLRAVYGLHGGAGDGNGSAD